MQKEFMKMSAQKSPVWPIYMCEVYKRYESLWETHIFDESSFSLNVDVNLLYLYVWK